MPRDIVSDQLGKGYHWDEHVFDALEPYLDGDVVDIGANVGSLTLRFAERAPRVIAYEPNDEMVTRLRENVRLFGFEDKVVIRPVALYSYVTTMRPDVT